MAMFCRHLWEQKEVYHGDMRNRAYGTIRCRKCGKEKDANYKQHPTAYNSHRKLVGELENG